MTARAVTAQCFPKPTVSGRGGKFFCGIVPCEAIGEAREWAYTLGVPFLPKSNIVAARVLNFSWLVFMRRKKPKFGVPRRRGPFR